MRQARGSQAGFTLVEMMISMGIMMVVMGGTFAAMTQAMQSERAARQLTGMNNNLRASMDLIVRDMLQVGQGLPVGRRIGIPNGVGATPINRPGPAAAGGCAGVTTFPDDATIPAVTVGPDLGPPVNGQCTDVVTTVAVDGAAEGLNVSSIAADGRSLTIHPSTAISDNPDANGDNLRAGDLLMLRKGSSTVLMQVTAVAGQTVSFASGSADPLALNQVGVGVAGTIIQLRATPTADAAAPAPDPGPDGVLGTADDPPGGILRGPTSASRIRMITYYVNTTLDPANPRLMRMLGGNPANAVGFDVQSIRFTYDIADLVLNPTGVRMTANDLGGGGACAPSPCSENQIRKVNVVLAMRSSQRTAQTNDYFRNTLFTQVSLRSLAFVDRYE